LGSGQVLGQAFALLRNVIVARMVTPADYGIASAFMVTVQLLESLSDLGTGTYVIQSPHGDDESTIDTAHAVNAFRAVINAIVLFGLAWPVSALFGIPEARWAFQCLALWPLLNGIAHLDLSRLQRQMRFHQAVTDEVASQAAALMLAWPLAYWLRDYSAILWLLLIQRLVATGASFLLAERPYRWGWNRTYVREMFAFGWPLIINGGLMYVIFQGDRLLIGASQHFSSRAYTLSDLGIYSVAAGFSTAAFLGGACISRKQHRRRGTLTQVNTPPVEKESDGLADANLRSSWTPGIHSRSSRDDILSSSPPCWSRALRHPRRAARSAPEKKSWRRCVSRATARVSRVRPGSATNRRGRSARRKA